MARTWRVRVEPGQWEFEADEQGRSLLMSALAAGVLLPNSCRNGTCRTCLCRLEGGSIRYTIDWPGVSREERAEGWILPCVAQPESDVVLQAPHARKLEG